MRKASNSRKGFFFVLTSLILLIYILNNLTLWSKSVSLYEERYSENFKISNIDYAASQINEQAIKDFSKIAADYALYKLNEYSIDNPLKEAEGKDWKYENINYSMYGLMTNGNAKAEYFTTNQELAYSAEENSSYTFSSFFNELNDSFSAINLIVSQPKIENFSFNQSSISEINLSFDISFEVRDIQENSASLEKEMHMEFIVSIQGLNDPAIAREMKKDSYGNQEVGKQMFFLENFNPLEDLQVEKLPGSGKGQGWFYGPIYTLGSGSSSEPPEELKPIYVLVGSADQISQVKGHAAYGAYMVTGVTSTDDFFNARQVLGEDKPIFAGDSDLTRPCPPISGSGATEKCLFFVSQYQGDAGELDVNTADAFAEAYNIEKFRDFVTCGYYFNNPNAPSYFQRLFDNPFEKESEFGISTFLVWENIEKGGNEDYSRLDIEFFNNKYGSSIIRGMPGCKSKDMCSETNSYVGQFKLSPEALAYIDKDGSKHLTCNEWATCGD